MMLRIITRSIRNYNQIDKKSKNNINHYQNRYSGIRSEAELLLIAPQHGGSGLDSGFAEHVM